MRYLSIITGASMALAAGVAAAHGPQIQINVDGGKIVSRELFMGGPYSAALTAPKSAYVMPLLDYDFSFDGRSYSYVRPNNVAFTSPGRPEFYSGPGFAYGYGWSAANPPFAPGTKFGLTILDSLKAWNGAAFVDAGVAEIQAYTGSNPYSATNTALPGVALQFPTGAGISYPAGNEVEGHATVRYRFLGDGANGSSAPDGVYLMRLQLSHPTTALSSDPFYYVLNKNASGQVAAAVGSLGLDATLVQYAVPEPSATLLGAWACLALAAAGRLHRGK